MQNRPCITQSRSAKCNKRQQAFCDIVQGEPSHFTFCHFIIDRYTLIWYNDEVCKKLGILAFKNPWRDMKYDEYIRIQENIREYLKKQEEYSQNPFLAEFEIWSKYTFENPQKDK